MNHVLEFVTSNIKFLKKQLALLNRGNYNRKDTERHTLVCQYNISLLISFFFFFFISGTSFSVSSIVERLPSLLPPHLGPSTERLNALQIEQENGIIYNVSTLLRGSPRDWVDPKILARITVFRGKGEGISRCNKNITGGGNYRKLTSN